MNLIPIEKTLDVEVVERQLAELWTGSSVEGHTDDDAAVLRARVANLLVYVPTEKLLDEVHELLPELTATHPSRVLMMLGERAAPDNDIEMAVASYFQTDKRLKNKRLCCEEVTLKAQGDYVIELPSAALPLLVSDLVTFLWWRDRVRVADRVFGNLLPAVDRLVIDSAEFEDVLSNLYEMHNLFEGQAQKGSRCVGISDLNWARLTLWRGLLADFYDLPLYQPWLDKIDRVRIDYVGSEHQPDAVAPQAWFIAGWLASRLGWQLVDQQASDEHNPETLVYSFSSTNRNAGDDAGERRST